MKNTMRAYDVDWFETFKETNNVNAADFRGKIFSLNFDNLIWRTPLDSTELTNNVSLSDGTYCKWLIRFVDGSEKKFYINDDDLDKLIK
jgi:hypothetical protein